jgi:hypothetical protein
MVLGMRHGIIHHHTMFYTPCYLVRAQDSEMANWWQHVAVACNGGLGKKMPWPAGRLTAWVGRVITLGQIFMLCF